MLSCSSLPRCCALDGCKSLHTGFMRTKGLQARKFAPALRRCCEGVHIAGGRQARCSNGKRLQLSSQRECPL